MKEYSLKPAGRWGPEYLAASDKTLRLADGSIVVTGHLPMRRRWPWYKRLLYAIAEIESRIE